MRISFIVISALSFVLAALLSLVAARFSVSAVERYSEISVRQTLDEADLSWAEVSADGLRVILSGTARSEAARFTAISVTGGIVDASRVIDEMEVAPSQALTPPSFSAEILRNSSGITIIGLLPHTTDRERLETDLSRMAGNAGFSNLIETADYPVPPGWEDAIGFALIALRDLPRTKISVDAGQVSITAITDSDAEKEQLTARLNQTAPPGLRLALSIAAPRPVITPFTLRFILDDQGGRFDACSAEDEKSRDIIVQAARKAGLNGPANCVIGMGVPSPNWSRATKQSLATLATLGGGSVTLSNVDITLVAQEGTDAALFERVVGELENALPTVFSLHTVLPVAVEDGDTGIPEFTATRSPEGLVQIRGQISDDQLRNLAISFAKARFGSDKVYFAARVVDNLPADWPTRVLSGIDALSKLRNGIVTVTPGHVDVHGVTNLEEANTQVASLLSEKLGDGETYDLDITYVAPPEPEDKLPDPEICEARISEIQTTDKIAFEPGSATIAASSAHTMDLIAKILLDCGPIRMEIQGHTDSQGREEMNHQLSQARAQSVLNELRARRVRTSSLAAAGYGETRPIADNGSEDGREANRRIEFWLIRPNLTASDDESTLDSTAAEAPTGADPADANAEGDAAAADPPEEDPTDDTSQDTAAPEQETGNEQN